MTGVKRPPCPWCGGKLLPTSNPRKVRCEYCGRVIKDYALISNDKKK